MNPFLLITRIILIATPFSLLILYNKLPFPFINGRTLFFTMMLGLALIFVSVFLFRQKLLRIRRSPLLAVFAIYSAITIFSTIFALYPEESFFGSIERSFGLVHMLQYFLLFLLVLVFLEHEKHYYLLLLVSLGVTLFAGSQFISSLFDTRFAAPPLTYMGNRVFLVGNVLIHVFMSLLLGGMAKKQWQRFLLYGCAVFLGIIIVVSGVRSGILGLVIGLIVFGIRFVWHEAKVRRWIFEGIVLLVIAYGLLFLFKAYIPAFQENYLVNKVTTISREDETMQARLAMWKIALRASLDRPILGWGRESYKYVFSRYFDPRYDETGVSESFADRPHNIFLNELVEGGILGLAAFLLFIGYAIYAVRRSPAAIALLVAWLVNGFFSIETINTYVPITLFLGYVVLFMERRPYVEAKAAFPVRVLGSVAALCIGVFLIWNVVRTYSMFSQIYKAGNAIVMRYPMEEMKNSVEAMERVASKNTHFYKEALLIFSRYGVKTGSAFAGAVLIPRLSEIFPADRDQVRNGAALAVLYKIVYLKTRNPEIAQKARETWAMLIDIIPNRTLFKHGLKEIELLEKKFPPR